MNRILVFHDLLMIVIVTIAVFVVGLLVIIRRVEGSTINYTHDEPLEVVWTLLPIFIFLFLAVPSITILFLSENSYNTGSEYVKAIAHQ